MGLRASVIVNNYNYADYVGEAVRSALRQGADEVIVVDDGSTDDSLACLGRFGERITLVTKPNGGQASALNAGYARARGDILIFLDADDALAPGGVARAVDALAEQPDTAKVMFRMAVIDDAGRPTGDYKPAQPGTLRVGDIRPTLLSFPLDTPWMPTSGNAYPRWVLERVMPIPEEPYRLGADYYLGHVAPLYGPVVALDEVGAYYRAHGRNRYERAGAALDLDQVRQTAWYSYQTEADIFAHAEALGLPGRPPTVEGLRSVSSLAARMVSLKLDPARHVVDGDRLVALWRQGMAAAWRRWDAPWLLRLAFMAWFSALLVTPHRPAWWLAERFFVPATRPKPLALLARLRHAPGKAASHD